MVEIHNKVEGILNHIYILVMQYIAYVVKKKSLSWVLQFLRKWGQE